MKNMKNLIFTSLMMLGVFLPTNMKAYTTSDSLSILYKLYFHLNDDDECNSSTGEIIYNNNAEIRNEKRYTKQCYKCKMLPICTICFQKRSESADRCCPVPQAYENAVINIRKYFYDMLAMNNA